MCFQPQRQAQQGWQEVSTNIPAFYKSYQDLSFLTSVLGVPVLPQNTCTSTMISSSSYYTQKVVCSSNRGSGVILFVNNGGGEGIIEFAYNSSKTMQAKLIINRLNSDSYIPSLFYDGDKTIAVVAKENWGNWTLISNNEVPSKGTVDSDLTGFTQVDIQKTPALDYGSLGDLASALGGVQALAVAEEGTTCSKIKQTSAIVYSNNQYLPSELPVQSQGILLTFAASVSCKIQIYVCQQMNYGIYIRYQWFAQAPYETWSIWKQIQYEA